MPGACQRRNPRSERDAFWALIVRGALLADQPTAGRRGPGDAGLGHGVAPSSWPRPTWAVVRSGVSRSSRASSSVATANGIAQR
jgi:hypothetical protein